MGSPGVVAVLGIEAAVVAVALAGCSAAPGTWFTPSTPTISIAATSSCPATLGAARDVPDRSAGSATLLPASGKPPAALACSYTDRELSSQTRLGAAASRELASVVNEIDLSKPTGTTSCPAQLDQITVIAFEIGNTDDVDLWWNDSGCQTVDNGRLGAFQGGNPSFYRTFQSTYARLVSAAAS
ncbi:hypothetical protein GCM10022288_27720 [Gryllotalpicola kribbensis]|uniref:DUF3558 domain-containing protein n=1 Tax=Gryllotalpicola kribbensis TaxID=993084 RepID=A0ABP8AYF9_9MICO